MQLLAVLQHHAGQLPKSVRYAQALTECIKPFHAKAAADAVVEVADQCCKTNRAAVRHAGGALKYRQGKPVKPVFN